MRTNYKSPHLLGTLVPSQAGSDILCARARNEKARNHSEQRLLRERALTFRAREDSNRYNYKKPGKINSLGEPLIQKTRVRHDDLHNIVSRFRTLYPVVPNHKFLHHHTQYAPSQYHIQSPSATTKQLPPTSISQLSPFRAA